MRVNKVINNNIVSALDSEGKEMSWEEDLASEQSLERKFLKRRLKKYSVWTARTP